MGQQDGSGRKRKAKKNTIRVWRADGWVVVRQKQSPQVKASRKAASSSMQRATAKAVRREAGTGATAAQIASRLGISEKAVIKHLREGAKSPARSTETPPSVPKLANPEVKPKSLPASDRSSSRSRHRTQPKRTIAPGRTQKQKRSSALSDPNRVDEARRERLAEAERHSARLRAVPLGESELERSATAGELAKALNQIDRLAHRKDDPFAWRDLALGFRARALRRPAGHALVIVGPEKVLRMIGENPSSLWGDDVIGFLEAEIVARKPKGPLRRAPLPHEKPGGVTWSD